MANLGDTLAASTLGLIVVLVSVFFWEAWGAAVLTGLAVGGAFLVVLSKQRAARETKARQDLARDIREAVNCERLDRQD